MRRYIQEKSGEGGYGYDPVFGISFLVKRSTLDRLKELGLHQILPQNKMECGASERLWGLYLKRLGIEVTEHMLLLDNSTFDNNPWFKKHYLGRE